MEYFSTFILYIAYKLLAIAPMIIILIATIKLHRRLKNGGTSLMLIGTIGLIAKTAFLDSVIDYLLRFTSTLSISNVSSVYTVLGFLGTILYLLFAVGFLLFAISWSKQQNNI